MIVAAILLFLSVAGCLETAPAAPSDALLEIPSWPLAFPLSIDAAGQVLPLGADAPPAIRFEQRPISEKPSWEATIGITPKGTAFYYDYHLYRSRDTGATWTDVTPHIGPQRTPPSSGDPYMWVDDSTGRVFISDVMDRCLWVAFTDDEGATWVHNPVACGGLPNPDYQKMFGGKPKGAATVGYPNVVYLCFYSGTYGGSNDWATFCLRSLDGGLTFAYASNFSNAATNPACRDGHGDEGVVGPDGTVYMGIGCGPQHKRKVIQISDDSGRTWQLRDVATETRGDVESVKIAVDRSGNLYYAWPDDEEGIWFTLSRDRGATWAEPWHLKVPGLGAARFLEITAGAAGRVAFLYLTQPKNSLEWHAIVAQTPDALAPTPVFTYVAANPVHDPLADVAVLDRAAGWFEFLDLQIDPRDGRIWAALMDSCLDCKNGGDRLKAPHPAVAVQVDGPRLA